MTLHFENKEKKDDATLEFEEFEEIFFNIETDTDEDNTIIYHFSNGPYQEIFEMILQKTFELWKTRPESCNLTKDEFALKCIISLVDRITIDTDDFTYNDIE